ALGVLFPTVTFAVFFMIVLPVSWALMRRQALWRGWILVASYVFYAWWDWHFVFLLAASTVVNHVLAVAIHRARGVGARKGFLAHLVAGPIVRASELLPQLERERDPRKVDVSRAFFLIVSGLFLKVVIANHLATNIVDDVFAAPNRHSSLEVLFAIYGYAVQIFADFCGYTNIAIGVALLLGFEFPQNFASPYTAVSLQDFWRRWHMTLSRWLRDYLYISLGGNRKGRLLTYRNLMLTML